jgi:hypothetical protein
MIWGSLAFHGPMIKSKLVTRMLESNWIGYGITYLDGLVPEAKPKHLVSVSSDHCQVFLELNHVNEPQ